MTRVIEIGFYGKVRTHGDFVGHGLPADFVAGWDAWLQRGMLAARERLGDDWLRHYLGMPLWRFALQRGVIGRFAYAGVLMPGIDAVGRYFPLVIACRMDASALIAWLRDESAWYEQAAELALSTLDERFVLRYLNAGMVALGTAVGNASRCTLRDELAHLSRDGLSAWWTTRGDDGASVHQLRQGPLDAGLFLDLLVEGSVG
jgi:type VI secretion system protein ImpM